MKTAIHTPQGHKRRKTKVIKRNDQFNEAVQFVREQAIAKIPHVKDEHAEIIANLHPFREWRKTYNHVLTVH
jgi:hypothetical protein